MKQLLYDVLVPLFEIFLLLHRVTGNIVVVVPKSCRFPCARTRKISAAESSFARRRALSDLPAAEILRVRGKAKKSTGSPPERHNQPLVSISRK